LTLRHSGKIPEPKKIAPSTLSYNRIGQSLTEKIQHVVENGEFASGDGTRRRERAAVPDKQVIASIASDSLGQRWTCSHAPLCRASSGRPFLR
jgi:hypothetical protein